MSESGVSIQAIGLDVLIYTNDASMYLAQEMLREMSWCEQVMCEANARELLKIAHSLDSIRDDIQKWYDVWKHREFKT